MRLNPLTTSLIFPTSAFSFVLSHDFSDGNSILCSSCIISRILSQRASSSGLISSCNSSAVKTLGSSSRWCFFLGIRCCCMVWCICGKKLRSFSLLIFIVWRICGIHDIPSVCACGENFTIDHAMICKRGGFVIQRHNELRDLEADLLSMVCSDVEVEPILQDITEEQLSRGSNRAQDARLDIRARGFWDPQSSAFSDVWVCHPNAESYRDQEPQQIYCIHENDKKRLYARRVLDVEHGSFTPLVFTTSGGMGKECIRYHSRLAELIATKKGKQYSQTISWIQARTSFFALSFGRPWFAFEDRG